MSQSLVNLAGKACSACLLQQLGPSLIGTSIAGRRGFSTGRRLYSAPEDDKKNTELSEKKEDKADTSTNPVPDKDESVSDALSRRLASMAEDAVYENPRLAKDIASGKVAAEDYGFSEILKAQLQEKLEGAKFDSENAGAISAAKLPSYAGAATRENALARPWTGQETTADVSHRMLQDAYKPLPVDLRSSKKVPSSIPVDLRPTTRIPRMGTGVRLANARDKSVEYAITKDQNLDESERDERRRMLKERFEPTGRVFGVGSIKAIESLAEQRITDAIARGQFKDLPRGTPADTDAQASNPFVDTTEYFLNKMIKKQEIVPPWIEKQRELHSAKDRFRRELRNDWGRQLARRFTDRGKGVEGGVQLAEQNAEREATGTGERIAEWEKAQKGYWTARITEINALCRSYNLMAPELAKRPYFNLERELNLMYKEVAPLVAKIIRRRSEDTGGPRGIEAGSGVAGRLGGGKWGGHTGKVYDEDKKKKFGFKEFMASLWSQGEEKR
ncbi:hypothetical protein BJ508DRAFT_415676 [Ascobolus immersus RN42]|uniref:DnaJ homologue subfamily C member 28 conserved domain-containing protein n=1 Tax=Ascobolus immersus RN42 TaxID=1160509 RepID=A0A3N4I340_ASCIM|nr:hypothetical protein BJ508DRAFT_415676 [Ascobolus immersus RN42]